MSSIEKAVSLLVDEREAREQKPPNKPQVKPALDAKTPDALFDKTTTLKREVSSSPDSAKVDKPVVGVDLDFKALSRARYLTPDITKGRQVEEYRLLKRQVLLNVKENQSSDAQYQNLIAICSASMGDGKTFTAFNLAMSIATEWDKTVLLIDGDLTRQSLTRLVGLQKKRGLTDVLLDSQLDLNDVIVSSNVPKLRLMPAGRTHSGATELLASEKMQQVAGMLATQFSERIVLFDSPPLLASSQAVVLTSLVGQVLLVVAEGRTPQKSIKEALALLESNKTDDKTIGIVLNKAHGRAASKYY